MNQGILLVSNLDSSVSSDALRQIFGAYGEVKEVITMFFAHGFRFKWMSDLFIYFLFFYFHMF